MPGLALRSVILLASLISVALANPLRAKTDSIVECRLERTTQSPSDAYTGLCRIPCLVNALAIDIDGPNPKVACATPPREVKATLARSSQGDDWLGTMEGKFPEDPTRFALRLESATGQGVAKLPYGWFALSRSAIDDAAMTLTINANRQLPPTKDDLAIVARAKALLPTASTWNRQDTRQCPPGATTFSAFCALMRATEEIAGGIHYRQPALQAVREVVNDVGGTRVDKHRLMDYNNHPDTTLEEVHALFDKAHARLTQRFR